MNSESMMRFLETEFSGAFVIEPELIEDERGFFTRMWSHDEFKERGLESRFVQCSTSYSRIKGTLRGLHYQTAPYEEVKLVRCTRGAIYDVIVDVRRKSSTFGRWQAIELSEHSRLTLYVPKGFAHGFMTLTDNVEVLYEMSERFRADHASGVRWNDSAIGVEWPGEVVKISARDKCFPDFTADI